MSVLPNSKRRIARAVAPVLAAVLLLTACGGNDDEEASTTLPPPETTVAETTTAAQEASTAAPPGPGDVPDQSAPPVSEETTRLTGVEVTGEPGAGRVTFTFNGAAPGYTVGYTTLPARQDGSGKEVPVKGDSGLAIRFSPASNVDLTGGFNKTYTGPERIAGPQGSNIAEVVQVSSYEQSLVWALGVNNKTRFEVSKQQNPSRVTVQLLR